MAFDGVAQCSKSGHFGAFWEIMDFIFLQILRLDFGRCRLNKMLSNISITIRLIYDSFKAKA